MQIGITSIGILNGIVGEAVPSVRWRSGQGFGVDQKISEYAATGLVVVTITYFSIVLVNWCPNAWGSWSPESIARLVSRPILWLAAPSRS